MPTKQELLAEAYGRGLLKGPQKTAYEEAMRRGLVKGPSQRNAWGKAADVMANLNRGLMVGDEIAAAVDTAVNFLSGKRANLAESMGQQRRMEAQGLADNRVASNLARGTGNAATLVLPGGAAMTGTRGLNVLRGAVAGVAEGAASGLLDAGDARERLRAANVGALAGGVLGAAGGALAPATKKAVRPKKVSLDALRAEKTAAYRAAEDAQIVFDQQAVNDLVDATASEMRGSRLNKRLNPTASEMLKEFQKLKDTSPSLTDLDEFRQYVNLNRKGISDADARQMDKLVANIDEFLDAAGPEQIVAGNKTEPGKLIRSAREANMRFRKVEAIQDAVKEAGERTGSTFAGGNIDNATRQELRKLMKKSRNLTDEERAAMQRIVKGTPAQNVLRTVGRMSPTTGGWTALANTIFTASTSGAGGVVPITGFVAKTISDDITRKRVQNLMVLMAEGGRAGVKAEDDFLALAQKNPEVRQLVSELIGRSRRAGVAATQTSKPAPNILATGTR